MKTITAIIAIVSSAGPAMAGLPSGIGGQLPRGYELIASAHVAAGQPLRRFEVVALASKDEDTLRRSPHGAPPRPLLIFEQKDGQFTLLARNDHVILKADEGSQCDPFLDGEAKIATKGRYFTVENGVACGQHWTDYITFRLDQGAGVFVFDNERREEWELNPSDNPDAEALVRATPQRMIRDRVGHVTTFASWRPRR